MPLILHNKLSIDLTREEVGFSEKKKERKEVLGRKEIESNVVPGLSANDCQYEWLSGR